MLRYLTISNVGLPAWVEVGNIADAGGTVAVVQSSSGSFPCMGHSSAAANGQLRDLTIGTDTTSAPAR